MRRGRGGGSPAAGGALSESGTGAVSIQVSRLRRPPSTPFRVRLRRASATAADRPRAARSPPADPPNETSPAARPPISGPASRTGTKAPGPPGRVAGDSEGVPGQRIIRLSPVRPAPPPCSSLQCGPLPCCPFSSVAGATRPPPSESLSVTCDTDAGRAEPRSARRWDSAAHRDPARISRMDSSGDSPKRASPPTGPIARLIRAGPALRPVRVQLAEGPRGPARAAQPADSAAAQVTAAGRFLPRAGGQVNMAEAMAVCCGTHSSAAAMRRGIAAAVAVRRRGAGALPQSAPRAPGDCASPWRRCLAATAGCS